MTNRLLLLLALLPFHTWSASLSLVDHTETWHYRKGTNAPQADWRTASDAQLDATWLGPSPGGFGYGDGDDATQVSDMQNRYSTILIRRTFTLAEPLAAEDVLQLVVDWDDGFVAWLDGVELARSNAPGAPGTVPAHDALATGSHAASVEGGSITSFPSPFPASVLQPGTHVLSLMGLNVTRDSTDLSLIADLVVVQPEPPPFLDHSSTWRYRKGTNAPPAGWQSLADGDLGPDWLSGQGGFGYGDGDDATVLNDMRYNYSTVYIRQTFEVTEAIATNLNLLLRMDWDDGFVAWLDGVEVSRSMAPGFPGEEPAFFALATAFHDSSGGGGEAPTVFDLGNAAQLLPPGLHVLAIQGLNVSLDSTDFSLIADLLLGEPPPPDPGLINKDTVWTLANSPYVVTNNLTVAANVTLTIEPGVVVAFNQGRRLTVLGRLLAEGQPDQRILFTANAGATSWDRIEFVSSPFESVVAFADVEYASASGNISATGTRLYLEGVVWSNTDSQLLDVTSSSILVRDCVFPGIGSEEPLHFSNMPANGYARIEGCVFDAPRGYNDVIDFTGGNRPGPIVEFIDNVFLAAVDECFDMDGTDAHIEGNIFMNVRQDATRSSSSNAISTGSGGGQTSELVIVRNIFYNCDHAVLLKEAGSALLQNNTVVDIRPNPIAAQPPAFINFGEPNRNVSGGAGAILDGNIVWDLEGIAFLNFTNGVMFLEMQHSIVQDTPWMGIGNSTNDPLFVSLADITPENIREKLSLQPDSPARGTGPNGLDMGALVPAGASISGVPDGSTTNTSAVLSVGGPGIYAYRWKLNDGPWSDVVTLTTNVLIRPGMFDQAQPIILQDLADGDHTVYVIGQNSAGTWQSMEAPTVSPTWTVSRAGLVEIESYLYNGSTFTLGFVAQAGQTYTVQYRDSLTEGEWLRLEDVLGPAETGTVWVEDQNPVVNARFYRLVSPAQP